MAAGSFLVFLVGDCSAGGSAGLASDACALEAEGLLLASFGSTQPGEALQSCLELLKLRTARADAAAAAAAAAAPPASPTLGLDATAATPAPSATFAADPALEGQWERLIRTVGERGKAADRKEGTTEGAKPRAGSGGPKVRRSKVAGRGRGSAVAGRGGATTGRGADLASARGGRGTTAAERKQFFENVAKVEERRLAYWLPGCKKVAKVRRACGPDGSRAGE